MTELLPMIGKMGPGFASVLVLVSLVQGLPQSQHLRYRGDVRDTGAYGAFSYQSLGIQPDTSSSRKSDSF